MAPASAQSRRHLALSPEDRVEGVSPLPTVPLAFMPFSYFFCYLEPLQSTPFSVAWTQSFFFFNFNFYLFIFGCVGSSLLRTGFL